MGDVSLVDPLLKSPYPRLFLHFFDIHFLEAKSLTQPHELAIREMRLATRFAVAAADMVFVPAASYVESPICRSIISELKELFPFGVLSLTGGAETLWNFQQEKLETYRPDSSQGQAYRTLNFSIPHPPFVERGRSATTDIGSLWIAQVNSGKLVPYLTRGQSILLPSDLEKRWESVPQRLGRMAFIVEHVQELLSEETKHPSIKARLQTLINRGYFESYLADLKAGIVSDLPYLDLGIHIDTASPNLSYKQLHLELELADLLEYVQEATPIELLRLRQNHRWLVALNNTLPRNMADESPSAQPVRNRRMQMAQLMSFIVHGRDQGLMYELKDYLQNTLGLPEPIVLEQMPEGGRTIIEKFEDYASQVDLAIVLMTPDDFGALEGHDPRARARQNVIFELGYFMGQFGRRPSRVLLLHKGELDLPSDLAGIIYIKIDNSIAGVGDRLRRELMNLDKWRKP